VPAAMRSMPELLIVAKLLRALQSAREAEKCPLPRSRRWSNERAERVARLVFGVVARACRRYEVFLWHPCVGP